MSQPFHHRHLRRLDRVWVDSPVYFITCCVKNRRPVLGNATAESILHEVWNNCEGLHHWKVGAYVIMPDHVHFFCAEAPEAKPLSTFVGKWKEWTSKYLHRRHGFESALWQDRFFDHLLRSEENYAEKWSYVQQNPVRAGLVADGEAWPFWGTRHLL
jgi:REP element-mobilizing transposase RayT